MYHVFHLDVTTYNIDRPTEILSQPEHVPGLLPANWYELRNHWRWPNFVGLPCNSRSGRYVLTKLVLPTSRGVIVNDYSYVSQVKRNILLLSRDKNCWLADSVG